MMGIVTKRFLIAAFILQTIALPLANAGEATGDMDKRPDVLKALDGNWVMTGDVMGRPATMTWLQRRHCKALSRKCA
jgi:hypothetical protein